MERGLAGVPARLHLLPLVLLGSVCQASRLAAWHGTAQSSQPATGQSGIALLGGSIACQAACALQRAAAAATRLLLLLRLWAAGVAAALPARRGRGRGRAHAVRRRRPVNGRGAAVAGRAGGRRRPAAAVPRVLSPVTLPFLLVGAPPRSAPEGWPLSVILLLTRRPMPAPPAAIVSSLPLLMRGSPMRPRGPRRAFPLPLPLPLSLIVAAPPGRAVVTTTAAALSHAAALVIAVGRAAVVAGRRAAAVPAGSTAHCK